MNHTDEQLHHNMRLDFDLGLEGDPERIATAVVDGGVDVVELCLAGTGGVLLLRELLRRLLDAGRRDVSIVVHRTR